MHDDDYSKGLPTTEDYLKRTKEWYGVEASLWDKDGGASVEVEYKRWCSDLKNMTDVERAALNSSEEWSSARSRARYPHIFKAALWHSSVAMTNVPVERVFAYMRKMEAFDRLTMDEDSFDYELLQVQPVDRERALRGRPRAHAAHEDRHRPLPARGVELLQEVDGAAAGERPLAAGLPCCVVCNSLSALRDTERH